MKTQDHKIIKSKLTYKEILKKKMDEYVQFIYLITKKFPKDELFGVTSQIRRSAISTILNYIEGFARRKPAVQLNFLETSYGSVRESRYLLYFSYSQKWITKNEYEKGMTYAQEIGAMLWTEILNLDNNLNKY